jgi:hypothetical protein
MLFTTKGGAYMAGSKHCLIRYLQLNRGSLRGFAQACPFAFSTFSGEFERTSFIQQPRNFAGLFRMRLSAALTRSVCCIADTAYYNNDKETLAW